LGIYTGVFRSPSGPRSATRAHCFAKRRLSDSQWVYLPHMRFSEQTLLANNIGQAKFESYYGQILQSTHGYRLYDFYYPYTVNGAFLLIVGQNGFSPTGPVEVLGLYQIQNEDVEQYLPPVLPAGKQTWTGVEVSNNLDRIFPSYSMIKGYSTLLETPELFIFNDPSYDSLGAKAGNKSTDKDFGAYIFSFDKQNKTRWSNYDILEYLFYFFINDENNSSIRWEIDGDGADILKNIYEVHDFNGKSCWDIINELVSKSHGLMINVLLSYDSLRPVLNISSTMPPNIFGNLGISSGTRTRYYNINLEQQGVVQNSLSFDEAATYDIIQVVGGPIYTTSTFSLINETLEKNWTTEQEQEYLFIDEIYPIINMEEADQARSAEKYSDVFLNFKVPDDWDGVALYNVFPGDTSGNSYVEFPLGLNYFPKINPRNGYLDFTYTNEPLFEGLEFEPRTPIQNDKNENTDTWVGVAIDPEDIDVLTDKVAPKYFRLDNLSNINLTSSDIELGENELTFKIKANQNYQYAKNTIIYDETGTSTLADWSDGTGQIDISLMDRDKIKIDYNDIFITTTIKSKNKLNLIRYANTFYETPRRKRIDLPEDTCIHLVLPYTIKDVIPSDTSGLQFGDLEYYDNVFYIKNDMNKLRTIMELALSVYGIPRSSCTFTVADSLPSIRVGDYIVANIGRIGTTFINSNITSISRSYTDSGIHTTVTTSFEELNWNSIYDTANINNKFKEQKEFILGTDGKRSIIRPKKGEVPAKPIRRVDDFPEIPKSKSETIFLTTVNTSQQNSQKWGASPGDTRWHPLEKYVTIAGLPNELAGDSTS